MKRTIERNHDFFGFVIAATVFSTIAVFGCIYAVHQWNKQVQYRAHHPYANWILHTGVVKQTLGAIPDTPVNLINSEVPATVGFTDLGNKSRQVTSVLPYGTKVGDSEKVYLNNKTGWVYVAGDVNNDPNKNPTHAFSNWYPGMFVFVFCIFCNFIFCLMLGILISQNVLKNLSWLHLPHRKRKLAKSKGLWTEDALAKAEQHVGLNDHFYKN